MPIQQVDSCVSIEVEHGIIAKSAKQGDCEYSIMNFEMICYVHSRGFP